MNEESPSRGWYARFSEHRDGFVQRICDIVEVQLFPRKETLVEPSRKVRSVVVVHRPAGNHVIGGTYVKKRVLTTSFPRHF
jgi:hypothetical protein